MACLRGAFFAVDFAGALAAFFAGFLAAGVAVLAARLTELGASGSSHLTMGGCAPRFAAPPLLGDQTGLGASTPTGSATVDIFADLREGATLGVEALAVTLALASLPGFKLDFAAALLAVFLAGLAVTWDSPLSVVWTDGAFGFIALVAGDLPGETFAALF